MAVNIKIPKGTELEDSAKARGRPKALDRDRVLECAVMQYWANGPADVSINDICKMLGVSKPGVYREFGSDDGLKVAALHAYQALAIEPFLALLKPEQPLQKTLEDIVAFLMQDRDEMGIPKGCLFVAMRAQRDRLGPETLEALDELRGLFLSSIGSWVEASIQAGNFRSDAPAEIATHYIDALHAAAMRMQKEGAPDCEIEGLLRYGLVAVSTEKSALPQPH